MKNVKSLFRLLEKHIGQYALAAILLVAGIFFRMLEPKIFQLAIDNVISWYKHGEKNHVEQLDIFGHLLNRLLPAVEEHTLIFLLISLVGLYLLISIVRSAFMLLASALNANASERAIKLLRDKLFGHIQRLPVSYFNVASTGELIQRCTGDVDTIRKFISNQIVEAIRLSAIFFFSFLMMVLVSWKFALIATCMVPILTVGAVYFFRKEQQVWEEHEKEADALNTIVQENLNGIRVVQSFAREQQEIEKFDRQNIKKRTIGLKHVKLHQLYWPVSDLLVHAQIVLSILASFWFITSGAITPGELVAFYTYIIMVAWPLRQVGRIVSEMGMALVAMDRIYHILEAKEEAYVGSTPPSSFDGKIEFKNVSFRYPKQNTWALKNINFSIEPGQIAAFVGPTGSGKSTITKLLLRFYEPQEGHILIDGHPISQIDKHTLRKRLGLVLQSPFLFSATIKENIAYTSEHASMHEIEAVVGLSGISEIEQIFKHGYKTVVGEKGVTLSGGQKQRLALARTLISDPDILILDDVTSAVDTDTERKILSGIRRRIKEKTMILISHRFTTVSNADKIIVLDHGKVAAIGSHNDLIETDAYYQSIYEIQSNLETELTNNKIS